GGDGDSRESTQRTNEHFRQYLTNLGLGCGSLAFQRRKRRALSLNVFAVRPSIRQALDNNALSEFVRALRIVHAKRNAVVMAEIEFRQITVQMLFSAVLVGAAHATLEN